MLNINGPVGDAWTAGRNTYLHGPGAIQWSSTVGTKQTYSRLESRSMKSSRESIHIVDLRLETAWRPTLRQVPLARVLQERGVEFAPLIALITAAVQIDTRKRPGSYDSLIGLISGPHEVHGVDNRNSVTDLMLERHFLETQGGTKNLWSFFGAH